MTTHTYAILEVSPATYAEIADRLRAAGYEHAFHEDGVIDMHGIALAEMVESEAERKMLEYIKPAFGRYRAAVNVLARSGK